MDSDLHWTRIPPGRSVFAARPQFKYIGTYREGSCSGAAATGPRGAKDLLADAEAGARAYSKDTQPARHLTVTHQRTAVREVSRCRLKGRIPIRTE